MQRSMMRRSGLSRSSTPSSAVAADLYRISPLRRWYFRAATPAEVSPTVSASWTEVDGQLRRHLAPGPTTTDTIAAGVSHSWAAGELQLSRQYVGPPMRGGILISTFSGVIKAVEGDATDNVIGQIGIRVVSEDGVTEQAVLLAVAPFVGSLEIAATAATRIIGSVGALTSYTTVNGDRLVVELGLADASGTTPAGQFTYGSSAASDYALTNGLTTSINPWIEFA